MPLKYAGLFLVLSVAACRAHDAQTPVSKLEDHPKDLPDLIEKAGWPVEAQPGSPQTNLTSEATPEGTCTEIGGTPKMLLSDEQAIGFCKLGRSLIAQDTLHQLLKFAIKQRAIEVFLAHPRFDDKPSHKLMLRAMGNPSRLYCLRTGGSPVELKGDIGLVGICRMKDGSMMSSWTLFNGPTRSEELTATLAVE